jgi:hypothetical protein
MAALQGEVEVVLGLLGLLTGVRMPVAGSGEDDELCCSCMWRGQADGLGSWEMLMFMAVDVGFVLYILSSFLRAFSWS